MNFLAFSVFFATLRTTNGEKHSLTYIYTAFSHPVELPGIHEFTAMGLLDNRMIDYYDSTVQKKIPKQKWMKKRLTQEYWLKSTRSRQYRQTLLKDNINILINQTGQNSNDTHVLRWMRGCEGLEDEQANLQFVRSMDMYNYDGDDFLAFNNTLADLWYSTAKDTKTETPPDVYMFSKKAKESSNVVLTCLATGFYPKDITLNIRRDGRVLTREDGLNSSGVRPNHDETFQRRDYVEILRSDSATYTCEFSHPASDMHVVKTWGSPGPNIRLILGIVFGICGVLAIVVILVLCKKKMLCFRNRINQRRGLEYQPTENKDPDDMDSGPVVEIFLTEVNKDSGSSLDSNDSAIGGCN